MTNNASIAHEAIWDILEFYKIQPRVQELQIEKIEEYLVLMNAHYQDSMMDIDECIGLTEPVCLEDVVDVLNSYLSRVGEELIQIFPENTNAISPIHLHSNSVVSEIQIIELYRNFNAREKDVYQIKEAIDDLETCVYEENFADKLALLTKDLLSKINSDLIVRVDDLI